MGKSKIRWETHPLYEYASGLYRANWRQVLESAHIPQSSSILDIGCGEGELTKVAASQSGAFLVCGIDLETSALRAGPKSVSRIRADAQWLPFRDDVFDLVLSNQVVEHVLDTDRFLRDAHRVLKVMGVFVISTPNLCSLHNRLLVLTGRQPTCLHVSEVQVGNPLRGVMTHGHLHAFAPAALQDILKHHTFEVLNIRGSVFYPFPRLASAILARIFPRSAVYLVATARKRET